MRDCIDDVRRELERVEVRRQEQSSIEGSLGVGQADPIELVDGLDQGADRRERVGEDDEAGE